MFVCYVNCIYPSGHTFVKKMRFLNAQYAWEMLENWNRNDHGYLYSPCYYNEALNGEVEFSDHSNERSYVSSTYRD